MKVYSKAKNRIEDVTTIGNKYVSKLTIEELVDLGYYPVKYGSIPSRRYYVPTEDKSIISNVYTINYTGTEVPTRFLSRW